MKFVNFQTDRLKNVGLLSDAEAGKVLKMMAQYASNGNVPDDVPPVSAILFQAIQEDMEYFDTKYSKRCETNKRIAKERGQTYKPTGLKAFITRLGNLSGGNGEVALKIIEQSMANNYSGVFPLNSNRAVTNTPDMGVVLQDSNNKDYSKGGW